MSSSGPGTAELMSGTTGSRVLPSGIVGLGTVAVSQSVTLPPFAMRP
jgi:hypothetical protein